MKIRITSIRDVEDELKVRLGRRGQRSAAAHWEFRGKPASMTQWIHQTAKRAFRRGPSTDDPRQQRVVIKASFTVHKPGQGRHALRAYLTYLARDSASLDGRTGRFYDAREENIDARERLREWEQDRHHFRFIISPERADLIEQQPGGLRGYIRHVLTQAERDLGTKLTWLAINHYNTDDLHAHVLVRGKKENGQDLVIPRQFIKQGMRQAAQQIATRWIGPRSAEQVREANQKELTAQRYTSLDAFIERNSDSNHRLRLSGKGGHGELRRHLAARLRHLEQLGLASKDRLGRWIVDAELKSKLSTLSQRNDIIKSLYAKLGPRSGAVAFYEGGQVTGRIISMGAHDELRDKRFLALEDANGRVLYARPVNRHVMPVLEEGSLVRLRPLDHQPAGTLQSKVRHGFAIVEVISPRSIQSQIAAQAWTWLDRQIHLRSLGKETSLPFDSALEQAATARQHWMVKHEYAQMQDGHYRLRQGAQQILVAKESQAMEAPLQRRFGARIQPVPAGAEMTGAYRATLPMHSGINAVIQIDNAIYLVPIHRPARVDAGAVIRASIDDQGRGKIVAIQANKAQEADRE